MSKRDRVECTCKTCGNIFEVQRSRKASYCSKACLYARNDTTRACEHCGKLFRSAPSQMHVRTCSTGCGYKVRILSDSRVRCTCAQCQRPFWEFVSRASRRRFCSFACRSANTAFLDGQRANTTHRYDDAGRISIKSKSRSGRAYYRVSPAKENAKGSARRASKQQATVAWADKSKMDSIYALAQRVSTETGMIHHVDHAVPLTSEKVCGLHNEFNLQVLPGPDNLRKHNRTWPDMW